MSEYKLGFDGYQVTLQQGGQVIGSWSAVSGQPGYQSPKDTGLRDKGAIPEGQWSFSMSDVQINTELDNLIGFAGKISGLLSEGRVSFGEWYGGSVAWGVERAFLSPSPTTNTFGRSGFSIHGGDVYGSAGCIDLGHEEVSFFGTLAALGIDKITLDVSYHPQLTTQPHPLAGKFALSPRPTDYSSRNSVGGS